MQDSLEPDLNSNDKVASGSLSLRYAGSRWDIRSGLMHFAAFLQRRKVVILKSNPSLCGEILSASDKKGDFLEHLIATPAWHPIYSIESMDGPLWEQLASDFKKLMAQLGWRERLGPLSRSSIDELSLSVQSGKIEVIGAEEISRLSLRILYELLFDQKISNDDETLFYQASLEWRKEIAVKGKANAQIKSKFWHRLSEIVAASRFKEGLVSYEKDPSSWLSIFAQPFLISPQINLSDIFVSVFHYLRADPALLEKAKDWARTDQRPLLDGILLEAIRLKHPFPILERELKKNLTAEGKHYSAGTQFFIILDELRQDQSFLPERWLAKPSQNPHFSIPFGSGPRMCIGKPIAMELMIDLLKAFLLRFEIEVIQPEKGHLYSGRNNDGGETLAETWYQLKVFSRVLWKSLCLGFRR